MKIEDFLTSLATAFAKLPAELHDLISGTGEGAAALKDIKAVADGVVTLAPTLGPVGVEVAAGITAAEAVVEKVEPVAEKVVADIEKGAETPEPPKAA